MSKDMDRHQKVAILDMHLEKEKLRAVPGIVKRKPGMMIGPGARNLVNSHSNFVF